MACRYGQGVHVEQRKVSARTIANYMKDNGFKGKGFRVGYDMRKWSRRFADGACRVMLGNCISTYITQRDAPTPVKSFEVFQRKAGGAVMITAKRVNEHC